MRSSQIFFSIKGGAITERHRSSIVKLPLPPCPTYSNKFLMDSASPILFFPLDYYFFLSIITYSSKLDLSESIRNLFEQVGRGGRGSLTIDDLCLSGIAPPLMEKIRDGLIGDKIQINKQTSDEWRLFPELNPYSVSAGQSF